MTSNQDGRTMRIQGTPVPRLGLGTWRLTGADGEAAVRDALDLGYRHIDTARSYGNEPDIGRAVRSSGVAREDVFLTTKVWYDQAEPALFRASAEASLRDLGTDYVDLLLFHWPNPEVPLEQTLATLVELKERGLTRQIGVSNFPVNLLRRALEIAPLFCNQVEFHPFLEQDDTLAVAAEHDLMVTGYAPLAHGRVFGDPVLEEIAARHGTGPAQVVLRWLLDHPRVSVVPKAASHRNRVGNLEVWSLELSDEDRAAIDGLPKDRRVFDPEWAPDWAA